MADGIVGATLRRPEGGFGAAMLLLAAALALAAPLLAPGDPLAMVGRPLLAPLVDPALPLGTDRLGRSIAAGLVHGAQASLVTGLAVAVTALCVGAACGAVAQPANAPNEARAESFRKSRRGSIREYGVLSMEYGGGPKEG
jgi:ABC-type dipeptide/oligopeptide/nickel transport system permease subunit